MDMITDDYSGTSTTTWVSYTGSNQYIYTTPRRTLKDEWISFLKAVFVKPYVSLWRWIMKPYYLEKERKRLEVLELKRQEEQRLREEKAGWDE
jgi:hypothetical protein